MHREQFKPPAFPPKHWKTLFKTPVITHRQEAFKEMHEVFSLRLKQGHKQGKASALYLTLLLLKSIIVNIKI